MVQKAVRICAGVGLVLLLITILVMSQPAAAAGESVSVWMTTADQSKLLQQQSNVTFAANSGSNSTTITVNPSTTYQQMDGFGAAMSESSAYNIYTLMSASQRTTLMNNLFGASGARLSFVRLPMGSTDFSLSNYTYDQTCCDLNDFSVSHDATYIIPALQSARSINPSLRIIGSPWTAPTWMKDSGAWGSGTLQSTYYSTYAQYFVKFIQAYQNTYGLPIYAVTIQNEPQYAPGSYPGMILTAANEASFVKNNLGPALSSAGLGTKVVVYDHNWDTPSYPQTVLSDSSAYPYIYGSAFHCYGGSVGNQSTVHNAYPNKAILFTECTGSNGSAFSGDLKWNYQNLMIGSIRNWSTSVILWNLALNSSSGPQNGGCSNCRGIVTIASGGGVTYNVEYYALAQVSRFVDVGAYRIDSNTFSGDIENVAFKNPDGSLVVVALNAGSASKTFRITWSGQYVDYTLPAGAVATFKWTPGGASATNTPTRTPTTGPTPTPTRTPTPGPTATRTPTPVPGVYYRIDSRESGKSLDVAGVSTADGAAIQQWTYVGGANQQFEFRPISGTSYFQIVARHSGKCLDVNSVSTADGANIDQWTCYAANQNQQFLWRAVSGTSYYQIVARHSGKCLDVRDHSLADGARIQQWTCGTGTNQQWSRTQVP